jgi:acyl-coenzyme A thioesterase PaaI-like protein
MLQKTPLIRLNKKNAGTLMQHLGIVYTEVGPDFIVGTIRLMKEPGNGRFAPRRCQRCTGRKPGSMGSILLIDNEKQDIVGIEINANHLRKVREGWVSGKAP